MKNKYYALVVVGFYSFVFAINSSACGRTTQTSEEQEVPFEEVVGTLYCPMVQECKLINDTQYDQCLYCVSRRAEIDASLWKKLYAHQEYIFKKATCADVEQFGRDAKVLRCIETNYVFKKDRPSTIE